MNCTCNVAQRRLTPGVFNLKQFLNGSETMKWRLTTHYTDAGQCDLRDYEAFLVICVGGRIDEIMLTKSIIQPEDPDAEHILELAWNVGQYATELTGYTKYQIIFRSAKIGQLGVIGAGDAAANGVYTIDSELAEGTGRTWTNNAEGSGYKIKWDSTNKRWTIYKADGTTVVDYQTFANPEPCCGTWSTVAVGNSTAAVWTSDEAVMYISETIAADQSVTANFPTILRQVWESVRSMIIKSGVTVLEGAITESDWQGSAAPYYINVPDKIAGVPAGCTIVGTQLFKSEAGGGFSDIGNIKLVHETDGAIKLYSLQKVTGKAVVFIKGGNGYFVADGTELGQTTKWEVTATQTLNTEWFTIRSCVRKAENDVVVHWGDGSKTAINSSGIEEDLREWESDGEVAYKLTHTYKEPGTYIVTIAGRDYFGISRGYGYNWPDEDPNKVGITHQGLLSRCLDIDLPVADCVNDLSHFAAYSPNLKRVHIPTQMELTRIENWYSAFAFCPNLESATGFLYKLQYTKQAGSLFRGDTALVTCDIKFPNVFKYSEACHEIFMDCVNLTADIADFFGKSGFNVGRKVDLHHAFYGCAKITGTVPAKYLWENTSASWTASQAFTGCSDEIRAQVPKSWGGTMEEYNTVTGEWSAVVSGDGNTVSGDYSSADGYQNTVSGSIATAHGLSNELTGDSTHAIGGSNNIAAFGGIAVGLGNEINDTGQGAVAIGGGNKNITGIDAIVIGTGNSNVAGNRSVTIGFNAKCNAEQAVAIGTQVGNTADAKGGVFLPGSGTRVRILDPLGDGETDFLSCFRHTYKGQSVPETVEWTLTGDRTITPDVNLMSRLVLKGTGTATLVPNYLSDGDRLEIIYNASNITLNYPAAWIGSITAKGVTVVLIEQFLGKVFITTKYHE